jgi:Lon protease-like protein
LIILEGQARLHVTEELDVETPYRQVNAVQARERLDRPDEADLSRRNINGMLMAMASLGLERVTDLLDRTSSLEDAGQVADLVGWSTFDEPRQKQMLLETLNVYRRIKLVEQRVSELVSRVYGSDPSDDDAPKD